jgi:SP family sugar:H+ symporter-like MFS transporter
MAYAVKNRLSSTVYILPIAIQFIPAIINLVCAPLMPESPRWLCSQGRHEEAKKSLIYLYGQRSGGFDVDAEYQQLRSDVARISSNPSRSWKDCFKGIDRLRTATSVGALCLLQGQGLGFVASYSNILLAELTSAYAEIFIASKLTAVVQQGADPNLVLAALVILSSISFVTLDRIGRRTLLLYGSAISAVCMIAYGIIYSITPHPEGHLASLAVAFRMYLCGE